MAFFTPWKLSSQKLGFFLVTFGFIWGMMLLHFTIQQRTQPESSSILREQILDLSKRYIKALAEENKNVVDGPYAGVMTAYGKCYTLGAAPLSMVWLPKVPRGSQTWSWHGVSVSLAFALVVVNCSQRDTFRKCKQCPLGVSQLWNTLTFSPGSYGVGNSIILLVFAASASFLNTFLDCMSSSGSMFRKCRKVFSLSFPKQNLIGIGGLR